MSPVATTTGIPSSSPDPLDVLASEVATGVEQELEREGVLGRLKGGAGTIARVPARTRDKVAELVDTGLDRVYNAPLDVPTAQEAVRLLDELGDDASGKEASRRMAGILAAAGPLLARMARGTGTVARVAGTGAKFLPTGRAVALGTTAVLATVRIGTSSAIGVKELQVLASYLVERHRALGLPVDRSLVEQVTVQAYLDPDARIRLEPGARRGYTGLARAWTARSFRAAPTKKRIAANRQRVAAIERLDVRSLTHTWVAAGGSRGEPARPVRAVPALGPPPIPPPAP